MILRIPSPFTQPLITSSPDATLLGTDSPVRAAVSTKDSPSRTVPSTGIFSPALTRIVSPTLTSSGSTSLTEPSSETRLANSGAMLIRSEMDCLDLATATLWKSSPTW